MKNTLFYICETSNENYKLVVSSVKNSSVESVPKKKKKLNVLKQFWPKREQGILKDFASGSKDLLSFRAASRIDPFGISEFIYLKSGGQHVDLSEEEGLCITVEAHGTT